MKKWHKTVLVVIGAVVFSTVAIQASDVLRSIDGNLLGLALESESPCGDGAVLVNLSSGALCVDQFEAAPSVKCPFVNPASELETQQNINDFNCAASSELERTPWRYVSLQQAQQLCARSGKRLPNNDEWYALVSGMGDPATCQTDSVAAAPTGSSGCATYAGVHDMIGNVWEWIDGEVVDGQYNNRPVPGSGYVQLVDADGVVLETGSRGNQEYGNDYASTDGVGVRGMVRGGFYGSGEDAGLYAQNIAVSLDLKTPGVGFRCVKSI
tara:strand:- start:1538 stop:2341 length:804 start_codon:yes stop_codon:yes gene_type:complete